MKNKIFLLSVLFLFVSINFTFAAGKITPFNWDTPKNPEISFFFNNRRFITKYLGSRKNNLLKIDAILLVKGDKIPITSDGIHDNLATSEIQEIFNSPSSIKEIGEDLINKTIIRSKDRGEMRSKIDDMSFVLIEVK